MAIREGWERFKATWLASRVAKPSTQVRFFVVGTGRCGTTLVRNILNLHPEVYVPSESHWIPIQYEISGKSRRPFSDHAGALERVFFADGRLTIDVVVSEVGLSKPDLLNRTCERLGGRASSIAEFNDALYGVLASAAGRSVVGDKTPDYCAYMPLLQSMWPNAKFVHIIRDGRDVALSMSNHLGYQRLVALGETNWVPLAFDKRFDRPGLHEPELEDYIRLWEKRFRGTRNGAVRLKPNSYLEFRYEDLLRNPLSQIESLSRFLELNPYSTWLSKSAQMLNVDNLNKVRNRKAWEELTAPVRETLQSASYAVDWDEYERSLLPG